jgi:hypothetical protein
MYCLTKNNKKNRCASWSFIDHLLLTGLDESRFYFLYLRNPDSELINEWPVIVYNVVGQPVDVANTRKEYLSVWNADPENQKIGVLESGRYGEDFGFKLTMRCGMIPPQWVLGDEIGGGGIITEDGQQILDESGAEIITE